jgi:hypothetical protein
LSYQEKLKHPAQVLFVHLPLPKTYAKQYKAQKTKRLAVKVPGIDLMRIAVEQIIEQTIG